MRVEVVRYHAPADAVRAAAHVGDLARLLVAAVDDGASIGFIPPLDLGVAVRFWTDVVAGVAAGNRALLVAHDGDAVVGTAQLLFASMPNGAHRADVAKVIVAPTARRRGIARALMLELEATARAHGKALLVLDTVTGSAADALYRSLGYIEVGPIPGYALVPGGTVSTTYFYKAIAPAS